MFSLGYKSIKKLGMFGVSMGGLFGVAAKDNCVKDVFYGTDYHSHLAADWAGIALTTEKGIFRRRKHIKSAQFKSRFSEILTLSGSYGIGVMSDERQPVCERSKLGNFALATDATILNIKDIVNELLERGISLSEASFEQPNHTEVISKLIHLKDSVEEGIAYALNKINGCCTLVLLNEDGIYAARDLNGLTSLVLGKRNDAFAVATETCAFPNLGFKIEKFLAPGEIVHFNENGYRTLRILEGSTLKECIFYHSYFSDPTAMHEGVNVEESRNRCGGLLAEKDNIQADLVCGVPDSGIGHAIGYANKSRIPYKRVLVKYTAGWSRSYMPPVQDRRDEIAYYKLIPIPSLIKGKQLVIVDDSIRRGTQLRKLLLEKIWPYEPKEVHVRIGSPPQLFACIRDKADESRLAARRAIKAIEGKEIDASFDFSEYMDSNSEKYKKMVDFMAKEISATSLAFISIEDAVKATTLPEGNHCIYCWTGKMINPPFSQKKVTAYNDKPA